MQHFHFRCKIQFELPVFTGTYWRQIQINFFQNGQQQQQQPPLPKDQLHFRSLTRAGHLPPPPTVPRDILAVYAKRDRNSERKMAGNSNAQRLPSSQLIVNMPAEVRNRSAAAMTEVPRVWDAFCPNGANNGALSRAWILSEFVSDSEVHCGVPTQSWYFVDYFWHVPPAIRLILQLRFSPIRSGIPKETKIKHRD